MQHIKQKFTEPCIIYKQVEGKVQVSKQLGM